MLGLLVIGAKRLSFTQFDPFEDTERLKVSWVGTLRLRFTQFDPFEDTERADPRQH